MTGKYFCPVCGFPLYAPAYREDGVGSFGICICCRFEYGVTDALLGKNIEDWRSDWIRAGCPWFSAYEADRPSGWNPVEQLENIGVHVVGLQAEVGRKHPFYQVEEVWNQLHFANRKKPRRT